MNGASQRKTNQGTERRLLKRTTTTITNTNQTMKLKFNKQVTSEIEIETPSFYKYGNTYCMIGEKQFVKVWEFTIGLDSVGITVENNPEFYGSSIELFIEKGERIGEDEFMTELARIRELQQSTIESLQTV